MEFCFGFWFLPFLFFFLTGRIGSPEISEDDVTSGGVLHSPKELFIVGLAILRVISFSLFVTFSSAGASRKSSWFPKGFYYNYYMTY